MKKPLKDNGWPEDVRRIYEHDLQEMWEPSIAPHIYNSYHEDLRLYKKLADQYASRITLDVGCAQGTLALLLGECGYKVYAIDIRESFLDYAKTRYEYGDVEFICGDILKTEFKEKFDLIFANQVIEHLVYPIPLLKHLRSLLTPNGHLVMTTPSHTYIKNDLPSHSNIGVVEQYSEHNCSADGDSHFFAFTAKELKRYCEEAGFTKVSVNYYATPWITGHCKVRYLHKLLPVRLLRWLNNITLIMYPARRYLCYQLLVIAEI